MNEHEEKTIAAFILREKQDRYRFLLGSSDPRRRAEGVGRLNHCKDLNLKYVTWWPSNADIAKLLRKDGSPEKVYMLSCTDAIDGKMMSLDDAINAVLAGGWGTLISCIPGQLAYYYDELGARRALLLRKPGT
jgi:hypothetical protein